MPARIDDAIILDDIKRIFELYGLTSSHQYYEKGNHSEATIISHFGSYKKAVEILGLPYINSKTPISKEDIIQDVLSVFNTHSNTTRNFYLSHGKYSRAPIKRLFGTWNNLLKELDLSLNMRKVNDINKEEIKLEMMQLYNKYGFLTAELQRKESSYSQSTIESQFGSFNNLLKELNIPSNISGVRYTDEEIFQILQSLYKEYGFISCDLIEKETSLTVQTIYFRFKNLEEVCQLANVPYEAKFNSSKFAMHLITVLENELGEKAETEKQFQWLINPRTKRKLRIDAFFPYHNLAVEIDGKQHYEDCNMFYNENYFPLSHNLIVRQTLDQLKEQLIREHNINFLRLTYQDGKKTTVQKLTKLLKG